MSSIIKPNYGSNNQTITCSVASLGNASAQGSTAIDNTTNLFSEALVFLKLKSGASAVSATGTVNVYAYGTVDGGTTYTEGFGGTDGSVTLTSPPNARLIGVMNMVANATTYYAGPFNVGLAFGGTVPDHWGIFVENKSGAALDSTGGNHVIRYQGKQDQTV